MRKVGPALLLAACLAALPALAAGKASPAAKASPATKASPAPPSLRVGVEGAYPPFSETGAGGELKGFDIDIAHALCEELKERCALVPQGFDRLQDGLVAGETDLVVASLSITDGRRARYDFTAPYYQVPAKFVARRGAPLSFDPARLKGTRVGVQAGTAQAGMLGEMFAEVVEPVPYPTLPAALEALQRGEVPMVLGDALALDIDFLKAPEGRGYAFLGPSLIDPDRMGEGIGVAVRKDEPALRARLDQALAHLRADGRYRAMAERYFGFDIGAADALRPIRPEPRAFQALARPVRELPQLIDGPSR